MQTEGWVVENSREVNYTTYPNYLLRRLPGTSASEMEFVLLYGPGHDEPGAPVSHGWISDGIDWYQNPGKYRFFLRGSAQPWLIVRTMHDVRADEMLIALRLEADVSVPRTLEKLESLRHRFVIDDDMIEDTRSAINRTGYRENAFGFHLSEIRNIPIGDGFYHDSFTIEVTYLPKNRTRTYIQNQGLSWVFEFEADLNNKCFEGVGFRFTCANCAYVWEALNNSGYVTCPVCKTQPHGEPEVWDGRVWVTR